MRQFYELLAANFKMTVRNRQALFWLFLFPVMLMGLFGVAFANGQGEPTIGLVNLDDTIVSARIVEGFGRTEAAEIKEYKTFSKAEKGLKEGDADAVVVIPRGTGARFQKALASGAAGRSAAIDLYYDPTNAFVSEMARGLAAGVVDGIDRAAARAPKLLELKNHSVRQRGLRYIDFLVPGIIAMTLMNSAMFGLGGTIVNYRERGILRRLKVTPQPLTVFVSAQISNQLIFSILRAVLLVAVARIFFDVKVLGDYLVLMVVVVVGSLCFVTIAFTVASFAKNREIADSVANVITMPMMFLGGVFFPVDGAPAWIQPLIKAMPLKYLADATRDVMNKGEGIAAIGPELGILMAVTAVFFVISYAVWRWE